MSRWHHTLKAEYIFIRSGINNRMRFRLSQISGTRAQATDYYQNANASWNLYCLGIFIIMKLIWCWLQWENEEFCKLYAARRGFRVTESFLRIVRKPKQISCKNVDKTGKVDFEWDHSKWKFSYWREDIVMPINT